MMEIDRARKQRGPVYCCTSCQYMGDKTMMMRHQIYNHMAEEDVPFICRICDLRSSKMDIMKKHIHEKHAGKDFQSNMRGSFDKYILKKKDAKAVSEEEAANYYKSCRKRERSLSKERKSKSNPKEFESESVAAVMALMSNNPEIFQKVKCALETQLLEDSTSGSGDVFPTGRTGNISGSDVVMSKEKKKKLGGSTSGSSVGTPTEQIDISGSGVDITLEEMSDSTSGSSVASPKGTMSNISGSDVAIALKTKKKSGCSTSGSGVAFPPQKKSRKRESVVSLEEKKISPASTSGSGETVEEREMHTELALDLFVSDDEVEDLMAEDKQFVAPVVERNVFKDVRAKISEPTESATCIASAIPLDNLAVFIEATVRSTVDAVASAIIVAARKQPVPPEQDLQPVTNQLLITNSHLGEIAAEMSGMNRKYNQMTEILADLTKTMSSFSAQTSRLNRGVSTIETAISSLNTSVEAQSATVKGLVQSCVDSQNSLRGALRAQAENLSSVISRTSNIVKSSSQNGQVSGLVKKILHLDESNEGKTKEVPVEMKVRQDEHVGPKRQFKIPVRSVVMRKNFVAASPARPEFIEQMKEIKKQQRRAHSPVRPGKRPRET